MEYTKGKWDKDGNKVKVHGRGIIAICPSPTEDYGVMEFVANARLIAQAPRLLEALKDLMEWARLSFSDDTGEWADENDPAIIKAEQAIAKVEEV